VDKGSQKKKVLKKKDQRCHRQGGGMNLTLNQPSCKKWRGRKNPTDVKKKEGGDEEGRKRTHSLKSKERGRLLRKGSLGRKKKRVSNNRKKEGL